MLGIDRPEVEALRTFDQSILDQCIASYRQVSFDICWPRNVASHEVIAIEGGDDHWVPRDAMQKLCLCDGQDAFVQYAEDRNIPVSVVNNEAEGEEHLQALVKELLWFSSGFMSRDFRPARDPSH